MIVANIQELATEAGLNRAHTAELLGITRQQWYCYCTGKYSPRESTINGWLKSLRAAGFDVPASVAAAVKLRQPSPKSGR